MANYDLYGLTLDDIEVARPILEAALEVKFEARDSLYLGEYYRWNGENEEEFILKKNVDPFEDIPDEEDFPDFKLLLYLNGTNRSEEVKFILDRKASKVIQLLRKKSM